MDIARITPSYGRLNTLNATHIGQGDVVKYADKTMRLIEVLSPMKEYLSMELLLKIEELLKQDFREAYETLQPGCTDDQIRLLEEECLSGRSLPEELAAIYKWHNGQTGYLPLNQSDNRTFIPIEEVIQTWKFLNDPQEDVCEPVSKSWLPITHNGAGDHLVYDLESGKIISYWHDDPSRAVVYESLSAWLDAVLTESVA